MEKRTLRSASDDPGLDIALVTDEQAEQLVNANEAAPASRGDKIYVTTEDGEEEQLQVGLTDQQNAELEAQAEQQQLLVNGLVEWAVGTVQQMQQQLAEMLPPSRPLSCAMTRLDEGKLWLLSMYDDNLAAKYPNGYAADAVNPTQDSPDIWTPEGSGEVEVPTLHVVGEEGSSPEPPGNATAGGS